MHDESVIGVCAVRNNSHSTCLRVGWSTVIRSEVRRGERLAPCSTDAFVLISQSFRMNSNVIQTKLESSRIERIGHVISSFRSCLLMRSLDSSHRLA